MAAVAGLMAGSALFAGEQVQFKGSTSVELPKPKRPLDDSRSLRTEPERPNLEGGFVTPPAIDNSPLSDRKLRESMDKKKNWIYANPYEEHFDTKTEQFMKGEKGTGLYENQWMNSKEDKSLVQKFLEEKNQNQRTKEGTRKDNEEKASDRSTERENKRESLFGDRDEADSKSEKDSIFSRPKSQFETPIFKDGPKDAFSASPLDSKLDKQSVVEIPFGPGKSGGNLPDKEEIRQQQVAHEKEFDQILQTRLGSGSGVGKIDALSPAADIGRLDLSSGGKRSDAAVGAIRPGAGSGTSVTFTDGGASFGARPAFDGRASSEGFGFGGTVNKGPTLAPGLTPAQNAQTPAFSPAPFTLPFPQRKF